MDTLTFIAELVKALAWPLAVLLILLVYRKPITQLISLVQRLRLQGIELEFGQRVEELKAAVNRELPPAKGVPEASRRTRERLSQLAPRSPRAVVLEAWLELEEAALEALKRHNAPLSSQDARKPSLLAHALEQAGVLNDGKQEIFFKLRNLRNAATHASDFHFDAEEAMDYADAALRLAEYLRSA